MRIVRTISAVLLMFLFLSCIPMDVAKAYSMPYYINVDLSNNIVTVYSSLDDSIVRQMICSSGTLKYPSPKGTYYMTEKRKSTERTGWYTFEDGYGKYGSRIVGNYLFHSYLFLTKNDDDVDWETYYAMGTHASHGCIRLYVEDAIWIAENCLPGTRVKLHHTDTRYEYIKEIIYEETYSIDSGLTYNEFICMASNDDEMGFNSEGENVKALQERLIEMGLYAGEADGYYGPHMVRTIKSLQLLLGYPVTGVVNSDLLTVINSDECPTSNICNLSEGMSGFTVVALQQTLAALGLYSGDAHGEYDEATKEAVMQFQRALGYNADGIASSSLQQDMLESLEYLDNKFGDTGFKITYEEEVSLIGTITASKRLNVRAKKSTDSTIIYRLDPGSKITVAEIDDNGWAKIYYDGENTGYVSSSYIDVEEVSVLTPEYVAADSTATALPKLTHTSSNYALSRKYGTGTVNTSERLRLRSEPNTDSEIAFMLSPGNVVEVLSVSDGWAKVEYGGKTGYAYSKYFDIEYSALLTGTYAGAVEVSTAPSNDATAIKALVISEDGAKAMTAATTSSDVVADIAYGERMDVIFKSTSWTQVNYNGNIGYVSNDLIMTGTNAEIDAYIDEISKPEVIIGVVNTGSDAKLNMRASASSDGEIIAELDNGTEIEIIESGDEWHFVQYGGNTGYVMSQFIIIDLFADQEPVFEELVTEEPILNENAAVDEVAESHSENAEDVQ